MSADNRNHLDLVLNCLTVSNAFNEVEYLMICLFQALTVEVEQIKKQFQRRSRRSVAPSIDRVTGVGRWRDTQSSRDATAPTPSSP